MDCSDPLVLQQLLDGDLDETRANIVAQHVESCDRCRAAARRAAELNAFVQEQLGAEDEGEDEATTASLASIARRLPLHTRTSPLSWWRRSWLAVAAAALIAILLPVTVVSSLAGLPEEILEEAETRKKMWMYQPGKAFHWEVHTVSHGVRSVADGHWRTHFWRNNGETSYAEVSFQINPQGKKEFAHWLNADGSGVLYRARTGLIETFPPSSEVREAIPALPPALRAPLSSYLSNRALNQSLDVQSRRDVERLHGRSVWVSGGEATFSRGLFDFWGEVRHITVTKHRPESNPLIERVVHEYDIESTSYRLLRLKSTITYTDGSVGVHDSRWVSHREITAAEFFAQKPDELLGSGVPVVRLSPRDLAERRLEELNRLAAK